MIQWSEYKNWKTDTWTQRRGRTDEETEYRQYHPNSFIRVGRFGTAEYCWLLHEHSINDFNPPVYTNCRNASLEKMMENLEKFLNDKMAEHDRTL